jgi:hypothetical protein
MQSAIQRLNYDVRRIYHQLSIRHSKAFTKTDKIRFIQRRIRYEQFINLPPIFCREETRLLMPQRQTVRQPYAQDPQGLHR